MKKSCPGKATALRIKSRAKRDKSRKSVIGGRRELAEIHTLGVDRGGQSERRSSDRNTHSNTSCGTGREGGSGLLPEKSPYLAAINKVQRRRTLHPPAREITEAACEPTEGIK